MYFEGIHTIEDAKRENLIPLTTWVYKDLFEWIITERDRIGSNETRRAMAVKHNNSYALFVNDVTGRYGDYDETLDMDI